MEGDFRVTLCFSSERYKSLGKLMGVTVRGKVCPLIQCALVVIFMMQQH